MVVMKRLFKCRHVPRYSLQLLVSQVRLRKTQWCNCATTCVISHSLDEITWFCKTSVYCPACLNSGVIWRGWSSVRWRSEEISQCTTCYCSWLSVCVFVSILLDVYNMFVRTQTSLTSEACTVMFEVANSTVSAWQRPHKEGWRKICPYSHHHITPHIMGIFKFSPLLGGPNISLGLKTIYNLLMKFHQCHHGVGVHLKHQQKGGVEIGLSHALKNNINNKLSLFHCFMKKETACRASRGGDIFGCTFCKERKLRSGQIRRG